MQKLLKLIYFEIITQNKINNLVKYLFIYFLFGIVSITLVNNYEDIKNFGIMFTLISIPLSLMGFTFTIFKNNLEDGNLEFLLVSYFPGEIIFAKIVSLSINSCFNCFLSVPFIYIFFKPSIIILSTLMLVFPLLIFLSSALLILISIIQAYFKTNTNILPLLIMPLLIPAIIISGFIIHSSSDAFLLYILAGLDLILIPLLFILSKYLLKNIYNI